MSRVEKIVEGRSALEAYHERAAALEPGDVDGLGRRSPAGPPSATC